MKSMSRLLELRRLASAALSSALLGSVGSVWAADTPEPSVWLRVEAFRADLNTRVRVDDRDLNIAGTEFSFERYGMADSKTLPALQLGFRLGERWRLELEYFKLNRSGRAELDRDITFDGSTFPLRATLDSQLRSDVSRAGLGYSFLRAPGIELGAVAGLHVTQFDMELRGAVSGNGGTAVQREQKGATVPLPTLGVYGAWAIGAGWALDGRVDFFALKRSGYDGRLINGQGGLTYHLTPNLALGGGLRYVDYQLRSTNRRITGQVDYKFKGPTLFMQAGF